MSLRTNSLRGAAGLLSVADGRRLFGGLLLAALTALAGLALLGLSGWFIAATAIAGLSAATAVAFDVFAPAAGIRLLALTRTAGRYGERLATHDAALAVLAGLRVRLFRGWAGAGAARDLARRPARLLFRLTLDVDALDSLYLRVLVPLGAALAAALAAGVAFGVMRPMLGLAVGAFLAAAGLGIPIAAARAAARPAGVRARGLERLRAGTVDLVSGQIEWLMAGRLAARLEGIGDADRALAATDDRLNRIESRTGLAFGVAGAVLLAAVLLAMAALAEAGTIGAAVAALGVLLATAVLEPFGALRRGAMELGRSLFALRRIAGRLAPTAAHGPAAMAPPGAGTAVRLERATVRHAAASVPSLHAADLVVRDGERVALIGPSGAGKSTLLSLIAGEVSADHGRVTARPATLLTQRTELFQDSIRDNLRLADPGADDRRLMLALDAAGLRADVETMPLGLDTRLGEGGQGLSGGQSRRLALARLFLHDRPVWLLDEPTDGLDGATARDVLARIATQAGGRAVVVATHLRREAEAADRLVRLDRGRILAVLERGQPGFAAALAELRPD